MKNLCFTLLLALLTFSGFAQKIAIKDDLITVDKQPYAHIEAGEIYLINHSNLFYIKSLQNKPLFVVKAMGLNDPTAGILSYLQFIFLDSKLVVEVPNSTPLRFMTAARQVYAARLLKNGELDPQAVANFDLIHGHIYSDRRLALNQLPITLPATQSVQVTVPAAVPLPTPQGH